MPEHKVEQILKKYKIKYKKESTIVDYNFICDFIVGNTIIEVQGDYWHANPIIYNKNELNNIQIRNVNRDINKKIALEKLGYKVMYIWEYDLVHNYQMCENKIKALPPV